MSALQGCDHVALASEDARAPDHSEHAFGVQAVAVDRGALDHAPARREIPDREAHGRSHALRPGAIGRADDVVGVDSVALGQQSAKPVTPLAVLPLVEDVVPHGAGDGTRPGIDETEPAEMKHHFGDAAGKENSHGRVVVRPVRERVDEPGNGTIDAPPVVHGRPGQPGRVGDGGDVDQEVRRSAECGVDEHRVLERHRRENVGERAAVAPLRVNRLRSSAGDVEPDRLARRCERRVRDGETEGLRDHLRRRGGAEELTAATGRGTGAAAEVRGFVERDEPVREPRAERLHGTRVLPAPRRQGHAARDYCTGEATERREGHRHRRQTLVARPDGDDAATCGQAADQSPEHDGCVVAVCQRVEHPGGSL